MVISSTTEAVIGIVTFIVLQAVGLEPVVVKVIEPE
jgi:hypothetical protein